MKKIFVILMAIIMSFSCFAGCESGDETAKNNATPSVSISMSSAVISPNEYLQLSAIKINLEEKIVWSSSNEDIVSVDTNGLIMGVDFGTATVTAAVGDISDSCTVSVKGAQYSPVLRLSSEEVNVFEGEKFKVDANVYVGASKVSADIVWSSDNESIATVVDGLIYGISQGTANISVKTVYAGEELFEIIAVKILSKDVFFINENAVEIAVTAINNEDVTAQLTTTSLLADGSNDSGYQVSWSSSDDEIASVDANGLVTAKAKGIARITATYSKDGVIRKAWSDVNVYKAFVSSVFELGEIQVERDNTVVISLSDLSYVGVDGEEVCLTVDGKTFEGFVKGDDIVIITDGTVYGEKQVVVEVKDRRFNANAHVFAKIVDVKVARRFQTAIDVYSEASTYETIQVRVNDDLNQVLAFYDGYMLNTEHTGDLVIDVDGSTEVVLYYDQTIAISGLSQDASLFAVNNKDAVGSDGVIIEKGVSFSGKTAYKITNLVKRTYIQIVGVDTPTVLSAGKTKFVFDIAYSNNNVVMNMYSDLQESGKLISLHVAGEVANHGNLSLTETGSGASISSVSTTGVWTTVTVDLTEGVKYESTGISSIMIYLGADANVPFYISNARFE